MFRIIFEVDAFLCMLAWHATIMLNSFATRAYDTIISYRSNEQKDYMSGLVRIDGKF